jgi:alkylation response protein AidB-like acyl-CoA dehydrogenase
LQLCLPSPGNDSIMDLLPTQEQQQIIDTAASFLAHEFPVKQLLSPSQNTSRFTREHLQQIAGLGWIGIGLAEEFDGVGYGLPEEALLFVELGRHLLPPSLLGSVLAARIAAQSGANETLRRLLDGDIKVALATTRPARPAHIGASLDGEFLVFEAEDADLVLVADAGGAALLPLSSLQCVQIEKCIDGTLGLSRWRAAATPALCFLPASKDMVFLRGALLISAMLLGIAEATLDRSVTYAKEREQFGKPIGSFQAIKHYCAEMAIRCESVRALLYHATITVQNQSPAGLFDTYSLKALAIDAAQRNANTAVQIHGGMGYTQEMDIHLFVKRAQVLGTLFGSERYHLKKLLAERAPD